MVPELTPLGAPSYCRLAETLLTHPHLRQYCRPTAFRMKSKVEACKAPLPPLLSPVYCFSAARLTSLDPAVLQKVLLVRCNYAFQGPAKSPVRTKHVNL